MMNNVNSLHRINIDISGMCNLNCAMCSFQDWFDPKGIMSLGTFKKLRSVLQKLDSIALHCNAEPLLNTHIVECIEFAKGVNKNIRVSFITNGIFLTSDLIPQLIKAGLDQIDISMDGATKKTYEMIRKGAKFETLIKNIKELVRQRNSSGNNLKHIGIITVANKQNIHELLDIFNFVRELGLSSFFVNGCDVFNNEIKGNELYVKFHKDINIEYEKIFSALKDRASKYSIELRLPSLFALPYYSCEINSCIINWNGDVSCCPLLSYKRPYWYFGKKLMHPKIVFGNINETGLFDIWNSEKFRRFKNDLHKGKMSYYCRSCLKCHNVLC